MSRYASWLKSRLLSFGAYAVACAVLLACTETASAGEEPGPCEMDPCLLKCDPCGCCDTWNPCDCQTNTGNCPIPDQDGDGVPDCSDNCPTVYNPDQESCACQPVLETSCLPSTIDHSLEYWCVNVETCGGVTLAASATIVVHGGSITVTTNGGISGVGAPGQDGQDGVPGSQPADQPTNGMPGQCGRSLTLQTLASGGNRGNISINGTITLAGGNGGDGGTGAMATLTPSQTAIASDAQAGADAGGGGCGGVLLISSAGSIFVGPYGVANTSGGRGGDGGAGGDGPWTPDLEPPPYFGPITAGLGGSGGLGGLAGTITLEQTASIGPLNQIVLAGGLTANGGSGGNGGDGGRASLESGGIGNDGGWGMAGQPGGDISVDAQVFGMSGGLQSRGGNGGNGGNGGTSGTTNWRMNSYGSGEGGYGGFPGPAGRGGTILAGCSAPLSSGATHSIGGTIECAGGHGGSGGQPGSAGLIMNEDDSYVAFSGLAGPAGTSGATGGTFTVMSPVPLQTYVYFSSTVRTRGGDGGDGGDGGWGSLVESGLGGSGGGGACGGGGGAVSVESGWVDVTGCQLRLEGGSGGNGGDAGFYDGIPGEGGTASPSNGAFSASGVKTGQESYVSENPQDGEDGIEHPWPY